MVIAVENFEHGAHGGASESGNAHTHVEHFVPPRRAVVFDTGLDDVDVVDPAVELLSALIFLIVKRVEQQAMSRPQLKVEPVAEMIMRPFSTVPTPAAWHGQAQRLACAHANV